MNKNLGIILSLLLTLAVAAGIVKSVRQRDPGGSGSNLGNTSNTSNTGSSNPSSNFVTDLLGSHPAPNQASPSTPLKILTGSAKFNFLRDPELTAILAKQGITLELIKSGGFDSDRAHAASIDAAWPASAAAAADWAAAMPGSSSVPIFSTALALASWNSLMPVFEHNRLAKRVAAHGEFDLQLALPLMLKGTRWNQLADNSVFPVNKSFLVNTPDLRQGISAGQYLATLAYILNGHEVPDSPAKAQRLAQQLLPLITRQGFQEATLAGPFEDYLAQGMGKAPLVLVVESQFFEARRDGKLNAQHILLYPQPGLLQKHVWVGKSAAGKQLGELLASDPALQKIAAKHGFRSSNPDWFAQQAKSLGMDAPVLLNLAEAPNSATLEAMIKTISTQLEGQ
jgi:hypothetical protein